MANIHDLAVGQVVFSKSGRDKGLPFIIVAVEGNFVFLADGKLRKLSRPKYKKCMHIQPVKFIDEEIRKKIMKLDGAFTGLLDADLRKALEPFL